MPVMMRSLLRSGNFHLLHLALPLSFEGETENKDISQAYRTTLTLHCECCRGKSTPKEECISSHGKVALYALGQIHRRQMNGLKTLSNARVLIFRSKFKVTRKFGIPTVLILKILMMANYLMAVLSFPLNKERRFTLALTN